MRSLKPSTRPRSCGLGILALAAMLLGASPGALAQGGLQLHAPAYGSHIPQRFTCDGAGISPPLQWSGVPRGAKSLVFVLRDPDAPSGNFVHWLLYDIPADTSRLQENANGKGLPQGTRVGVNSAGRAGYHPPCPPSGTHRYVHELYALDTRLPDLHHPTQASLLKAMRGHVLAQAQMITPYTRNR